MSQGKLTVITGPMFAGKTDELIRRSENWPAKLVFKHKTDDRYENDFIVSHSGTKLAAIPVEDPEVILNRALGEQKNVLIDEIQFFPLNLANNLNTLRQSGLEVMVSGLDFNFKGEPFNLTHELAETADDVVLLNAICSVCGGTAVRSQRLIDGKPASKESPVIVVGGTEMYEPRCLNCFE